MFNFAEELIIDSYRLPWLIWIQLLVMLLLVILLYFFSLDLSVPSPASPSPSTGSVFFSTATTAVGAACLHNSQERENQSIEDIGSGTGSRIATTTEKIHKSEGCSAKDGTSFTPFGHSHHPCHFLGLAKQAFLKCLGLDFSSESSSNRKQRKDS